MNKKAENKPFVIAAHHYQTPDIVAKADLIGDSYRLAVDAAKTGAPYTIMCGVRFMAESVAILANEGQKVLMPENNARCPMADMITREQAQKALAAVQNMTDKKTVPIAYMNSWADIKSFTGEHGGSICTSGNAEKIMRYYLDTGCSIFFLPDYNLGMNTALKIGLTLDEIAVVHRDGTIRTCAENQTPRIVPRVFLWNGFCPIHMKFSPADIDKLRSAYPSVTVIVHPECTPDTVKKADSTGSTEHIYNALKKAPSGSLWAVGTEECFVDRMIQEFPDKKIMHLAVSRCADMSMTTADGLDKSIHELSSWLDGQGKEPQWVTVDSAFIEPAKKALETMVYITEI